MSRVNPALTNVTAKELASRAGAGPPSLREGSQAELFYFKCAGFLSRQLPSQKTR